MSYAIHSMSCAGTCLLTNCSPADVDRLKAVFATLTPDGWVVPKWLEDMGRWAEYLQNVYHPEEL